MKIVYDAVIKFHLVMETNEEIDAENIPTKLALDDGVRELITDDLGSDASCTIDIDSKYTFTK